MGLGESGFELKPTVDRGHVNLASFFPSVGRAMGLDETTDSFGPHAISHDFSLSGRNKLGVCFDGSFIVPLKAVL